MVQQSCTMGKDNNKKYGNKFDSFFHHGFVVVKKDITGNEIEEIEKKGK